MNLELISHGRLKGKNIHFKWDQDIYIHYYDNCLNKIEKLNPQIIYFIRSDSLNGETCIMLEIDDHHFIVLNTFFHFSIQNGHGGTLSLVDLRKLIMTLIIEKKYITKGIIVSNKIFNDLYDLLTLPYVERRGDLNIGMMILPIFIMKDMVINITKNMIRILKMPLTL